MGLLAFLALGPPYCACLGQQVPKASSLALQRARDRGHSVASASVGLLLDAQMVAHAVVVVKHLLVRAHVEVTLEPVQITVLQLVVAFD